MATSKPRPEWALRDFTKGLIDIVEDDRIVEGAASDCSNFIGRIIGRMVKRSGQTRVNDAELAGTINGMGAFYSGNTRYLVVAAGSKVYSWSGAAFTEIHTGLDTTAKVQFENTIIDGEDCIIGFNGVNTPFKWNGAGICAAMSNYRTVISEELSPDAAYAVFTVQGAKVPIKAGSLVVMSNESVLAEADYIADLNNGTVTFAAPRVNSETEEAIGWVSYTRFSVSHPFKPGTGNPGDTIVKDKDGNILTPDSYDEAKGEVIFNATQADKAPLTVQYSWVDVITADYRYRLANVAEMDSMKIPCEHRGMLFVTSSEPLKQSQIWWSEPGEVENWPPINYWEVGSGDGDMVTNLQSYLEELLIFKRRSLHVFRGISWSDFRLSAIETRVGCVGERAAMVDGTKVFFISEDGLCVFNGMAVQNLIEGKIPGYWNRVNQAYIENAVLEKWNGLLLCALPIDNSTTNNAVLAFDTVTGAFWPWSGINASCYKVFDGVVAQALYAGDAISGYVNQQDVGTEDFGQPIAAHWEGTGFDAKSPERIKKAKGLFIDDTPGDHPAVLKASADYGEFETPVQKGSESYTRAFYVPAAIRRFRHLTIRLEHSQVGACEIRGVLLVYKIRRKPKVRRSN